MTNCVLCAEAIGKGDDLRPINNGLDLAHRECLLRAVMGGIGHLEDHAKWCVQLHDPDGGRSYRQSAIDVDQWVRRTRRR